MSSLMSCSFADACLCKWLQIWIQFVNCKCVVKCDLVVFFLPKMKLLVAVF